MGYYFLIIILFAPSLLVQAEAAPQKTTTVTPPVATKSTTPAPKETSYFYRDPNGPGTYDFGYSIDDEETENIQFRNETRHPNGTISGTYAYLRPDGKITVTTYVGDEKGYRKRTKVTIYTGSLNNTAMPSVTTRGPPKSTKRPSMGSASASSASTASASASSASTASASAASSSASSATTASSSTAGSSTANASAASSSTTTASTTTPSTTTGLPGLNLNSGTLPPSLVEGVMEEYDIDLRPNADPSDILHPDIADIINGKTPLDGSKSNSKPDVEVVRGLIPSDFPIVSFMLPTTEGTAKAVKD